MGRQAQNRGNRGRRCRLAEPATDGSLTCRTDQGRRRAPWEEKKTGTRCGRREGSGEGSRTELRETDLFFRWPKHRNSLDVMMDESVYSLQQKIRENRREQRGAARTGSLALSLSRAASPRTGRIPRCDIKRFFLFRREGGWRGDLNKYTHGVRGWQRNKFD